MQRQSHASPVQCVFTAPIHKQCFVYCTFLCTVMHLQSACYLKMKMKSMSSIQKVATLSMVFISTTSCRLSAGMNLTSLMTLSSLNVLSTDRPPSAWPMISHTLGLCVPMGSYVHKMKRVENMVK